MFFTVNAKALKTPKGTPPSAFVRDTEAGSVVFQSVHNLENCCDRQIRSDNPHEMSPQEIKNLIALRDEPAKKNKNLKKGNR